MDKIRIIKKYPNRRLYDTATSQYTTLEEIKDLVLQHVKFQVVDSGNDENVTNYILLQIINENEAGHKPIFTTEILQQIIRFYGNPLQNMMSEFLEKCFSSLGEKKADFENQFQNMFSENNPFSKLADIAKQNLAMWEAMQKPAKKSKKKKT